MHWPLITNLQICASCSSRQWASKRRKTHFLPLSCCIHNARKFLAWFSYQSRIHDLKFPWAMLSTDPNRQEEEKNWSCSETHNYHLLQLYFVTILSAWTLISFSAGFLLKSVTLGKAMVCFFRMYYSVMF